MNEIVTILSGITLTGLLTNPNFFIIFIVLIIAFFLLGLILGLVTKQSKNTTKAKKRIGKIEEMNSPRQTDTFGQDNLENANNRSNGFQNNEFQNRGFQNSESQNNEFQNNDLKSEQRSYRNRYNNKYW